MLKKSIALTLCGLKLFVTKIKLGNFYRPPGTEAQYGLKASLFPEIRKIVEGNNNSVVIVEDFSSTNIN